MAILLFSTILLMPFIVAAQFTSQNTMNKPMGLGSRTWNALATDIATISGNAAFLRIRLLDSEMNRKLILRPNTIHVTTPTVAEAKYYLQYAAAVYCNGPPLTNWTCHDCRALGPHVKLIQVINNTTLGSRAFFAINDHRREIILSFRGTVNTKNLRQDIKDKLVPVRGGDGVMVHEGAWEVMLSLYNDIEITLPSLIAKYPTYRIIIIGHSLGAMVGSLCFYKLKMDPQFQNLDYSFYSYGSPRTGNMAFALWFNSQHLVGVRVVSEDDLIPHILGLSSKGYVHHLPEIWIHKLFFGRSLSPLANRICLEDAFEDPTCSNSVKAANLKLFHHLKYWNVFLPPIDCLQGVLRDSRY